MWLEQRCVEAAKYYSRHAELRFRPLQSVQMGRSVFGSLSLPMFLEKLRDEIKLQVNRPNSSDVWKFWELL